jgi:hypothetical protein
LFALLSERCPSGVELTPELLLSKEPLRADLVVVRRNKGKSRRAARVLAGVWPLIQQVGVLEYKSISRPLQVGDVCFVVPDRKSSRGAGRRWNGEGIATGAGDGGAGERAGEDELEDGAMARIEGSNTEAWVVDMAAVAEQERDEYVGLLAGKEAQEVDARRWFVEHTQQAMARHQLKDLEGYEDVLQKLLASLPPEQRLAGLSPEQRLAGLAPEERLAGLAPERVAATLPVEQRLAGLDEAHAVLALPVTMLGALSVEYIEALPVEVKRVVEQRLARADKKSTAKKKR